MTAERDRELRQIAVVAAQTAAELVSTESSAQARVIEKAATEARAIAEQTNRDVGYIRHDIDEIKEKLDTRYVTLEAFDPIRRVVYGFVGMVLLAIIGALITLVMKKP